MSMLDLKITCSYKTVNMGRSYKKCKVHRGMLFCHLVQSRKNNLCRKIKYPNKCDKIDKDRMLNNTRSEKVKRQRNNSKVPCRIISIVSLETVKNLCVPVMEDWKEENVATYVPWKSTEDRNIIQSLVGSTKAERKQYRLAERQGIQNLEKRGILNSNQKISFINKTSKKVVDITQIVYDLKRLYLNNFKNIDVNTLENIDINKLSISNIDKKNTSVGKDDKAGVIEQELVQKFKKLMLCHFTK
ncbi:uncharacterized protein LOC100747936 isoform X3 [Bombus impatiens]|uniref:Uncharacterized protein LOC100747936 isoform X3 n=1 Tax=Bombus impatiens TaxID=132113 RepID=A0A6P8LGJ4_BOMIM|nr:uncharacterized protein LOC100747936 isoform X3 [Bombus impatiens]